MKAVCALVVVLITESAFAATYTVTPNLTPAALQATLNLAGAAPGNVVAFAAGAYALSTTLQLPCNNGTIYTGPNVGQVSQANLPTAVLSDTTPTSYAVSIESNGTTFTGSQGCTIQYLRFSGTQGGILVDYPSSGLTIQQNAFDNNNPPAGGMGAQPNIWLDGRNAGFSAATGVQHVTIVWNTFFNNCAAIRDQAYPDSGGRCAATWVNGYNNYLTWSNNTVNLTEEGLKLSEQSASGIASLNADVEDNNLQGNSRILIETQQDTNGVGIYSHNAFYQPYNPSNNTFELSMPEYTASPAPTHIASDNVFIGNVPVTTAVGGKHYGIGLELWGAGSVATYNLFQGANGAETCGGGWWCSGWQICLGGAFTNGTIANNYFSGTDQWAGVAGNMRNALTYEEGASAANAGLIVGGNSVVQTSTTIATVAPAMSAVAAASGSIITLSDSDTNRHLSIFFTTDGSTPAIFTSGSQAGTSQLYTVPFTVAPGTTVKAIASWGQGANQGIVFPSFGYVPSSVVSLTVPGSEHTLTGAYLRPKYYTSSVVPGGTMQFIAYGTYSDGSVATLPDEQGNKVTLWNTSNHNVARISTLGHATAYAAGTVSIMATIGGVKATPWTLTVSSGVTTSVTSAVVASAAAKVADDKAAVVASAATAAPAGPGAPRTDMFTGPFWKLVAPQGGSASISNGHLFLGVPGGANHDALGGSNGAVRVSQAIGDQNFDVAIKIDSPLVRGRGETSEGLMVTTDSENFLTFSVESDGERFGLRVFLVSQGATKAVLNDPDFTQYQNPICLRLIRSGAAYIALYSIDGVSWSQVANFSYAQPVASIGPFAGNYSDPPTDAAPVVMSVNWFDVQQ